MTAIIDPGSSGWHLTDSTLRDYIAGRALPLVGASAEAHLLRCSECRARLGAVVPADPLERTWAAVRERVETPRPSTVERLARLLGASGQSARLLAAVPGFRGAWLLGVFVATVFAGAAAVFAGDIGLSMFLIVAPLAPVAGVAASFGGDADPAHDMVATTPYSALRLLLLRTAGVLAASLPLTAIVGWALPGPAWLGVAWLTPAVTGVLLTLLLGPVFGSAGTAAAIAGLWSAAVISAERLSSPLEVVEPVMQLVLAGIALATLAALFVRYPSPDRLGGQP